MYVSRTYLVYRLVSLHTESVPVFVFSRWVVATLVVVFLIQSFIIRALHLESWKYFLLLANWGRLLAVLTYSWEGVLVTDRWRRELNGEKCSLIKLSLNFFSPSRPGGDISDLLL